VRDFNLPGLVCPVCGYRVDGSQALTADHPPSDGDAAVCLACASLGIYTFGVTALRLPTPEERASIIRQDDVQKAVAAIIELRDRDPRWPRAH
jgi:hypothetical protein